MTQVISFKNVMVVVNEGCHAISLTRNGGGEPQLAVTYGDGDYQLFPLEGTYEETLKEWNEFTRRMESLFFQIGR